MLSSPNVVTGLFHDFHEIDKTKKIETALYLRRVSDGEH